MHGHCGGCKNAGELDLRDCSALTTRAASEHDPLRSYRQDVKMAYGGAQA